MLISLTNQRFRGSGRAQSGHVVIGTTPYRGHVGCEAEAELDISRWPAVPHSVAGEEQDWEKQGERGSNGNGTDAALDRDLVL